MIFYKKIPNNSVVCFSLDLFLNKLLLSSNDVKIASEIEVYPFQPAIRFQSNHDLKLRVEALRIDTLTLASDRFTDIHYRLNFPRIQEPLPLLPKHLLDTLPYDTLFPSFNYLLTCHRSLDEWSVTEHKLVGRDAGKIHGFT